MRLFTLLILLALAGCATAPEKPFPAGQDSIQVTIPMPPVEVE